MEARPRVLSIEYNRSIPPHVSLRQTVRGDSLGASALALCELADMKSYGLVGLTEANLFFVVNEEISAFGDYERDLNKLFPYDALTYLATDYHGHPLIVGETPPWGLQWPPYLRRALGPTMDVPGPKEAIRAAWEALYGPALFLPENWCYNLGVADDAFGVFMDILDTRGDLVIVDVTQIAPENGNWMEAQAALCGYDSTWGNSLLVLVREDLVERPVGLYG
jgi:hypothetical protein